MEVLQIKYSQLILDYLIVKVDWLAFCLSGTLSADSSESDPSSSWSSTSALWYPSCLVSHMTFFNGCAVTRFTSALEGGVFPAATDCRDDTGLPVCSAFLTTAITDWTFASLNAVRTRLGADLESILAAVVPLTSGRGGACYSTVGQASFYTEKTAFNLLLVSPGLAWTKAAITADCVLSNSERIHSSSEGARGIRSSWYRSLLLKLFTSRICRCGSSEGSRDCHPFQRTYYLGLSNTYE